MAHLHTVTVLAFRAAEALNELEKLARRARRLGCPDITVEMGEQRTSKRWRRIDGVDREVRVTTVDLIISGEAPRVGDWDFIARLELDPAGVLINKVPGEHLPARFREADGHCDHCATTRPRKEVFVCRRVGGGMHVAVGRSCLRDFLGTDSPERITQRFNLLRDIREVEEGYGWNIKSQWCRELRALLAATAASIRLYGWVSRTAANGDDRATADTLWVLWGGNAKETVEARDKLEAAMDDAAWAEADATINWVRHEMEGDDDYQHNLRVAFREDVLHDTRRLGLVISAVASFQRHQERLNRRKLEWQRRQDSQHLGQPKERLRGLMLRLDACHGYEGRFGPGTVMKMRDHLGNSLVWFTSSEPDVNVGDWFMADATVKDHTEFKGACETMVTRVTINGTITEEEALTAARAAKARAGEAVA